LIGDTGNISEADLDNYIAKGGRGEGVKQFTLFMSKSDLQSRLDAATSHQGELGLSPVEYRRRSRDAAAQVVINAATLPPF
jgi:hypothetical protein